MTDLDLLRELNRDVWHPFRAAYGACDTDASLALYAPSLIRAGGPSKSVQTYAEVAAETAPWFAGALARGITLGIDFRFVERLAAGGLASERGIYRITAGDDVFHGRFHTFSRRIDDRWQITVDYDTPESDPTAFTAAREIDDVQPFA
jgi:ketosteroid isomerase-like protein